jgi:hypothetical protein
MVSGVQAVFIPYRTGQDHRFPGKFRNRRIFLIVAGDGFPLFRTLDGLQGSSASTDVLVIELGPEGISPMISGSTNTVGWKGV